MRILISLLLVTPLLLLCSCGGQTVEEIEETFPDGSPKLVRFYKVDEQVRELVREQQYYPNHNLFYDGEFRDGKKHGHWTVWYKDGTVWSEGTYKNGLDEGYRTAYHENGEKKFEGQYKGGEMTGKWKFWDTNGKLLKEVDYDEQK